jgi:outer membrane cobalamin receptor
MSIRSIGFALAAALSATVAQPQRAAVPPPIPQIADLSSMDLEQLMKVEVVFAGSKRAQQTRDVLSYVSVVTAAEIKAHGYRTLADVLETLPSFYVSNDRNYSYVGVRGFDRPGDYSSRVLLLLNGLRTNAPVYDEAYIGEEFIVDVDLIERIEVIRGPGAALYGNNAFFAVINVVTKQGRSLAGGEAAATAASFGTYAGRASYGHSFANDVDVLVSASYSDSKGQRLYFPEFDTPATNNGIANRDDYESFHKLLATATKGNFSFQASNVSREKGVPTGSFGTVFNDDRTKTTDRLSLASLTYTRSFSDSSSMAASVQSGYWSYTGKYSYDVAAPPNHDDAVGDWWGANVDARRTFARNLVTVGGELEDEYKQNQSNYDPEPYVLNLDVRNASVRWGMFAQDEITLFQPLKLYAGVRYDWYQTFGSATSPRVGLIYTPDEQTTFKLLAGRAFRAPNAFELYYAALGYDPNPRLQPEHIETLELLAQRLIGGGVQLSTSLFRNNLSNLISEHVDTTDGHLHFSNAGRIVSQGVEVGLDVNRGHGLTGGLAYTLQDTEDPATRIDLTNSPQQMLKLHLLAPVGVRDATAGIDVQYMSERGTLAGTMAPAYVLTNLSLLMPRAFKRFDLSATIYNLFGETYGSPGGPEQTQNIIQQDGRSFRVKTTLHF